MDDKQKRFDDLRAKLQSVSYDDFEIGLPYNDANEYAKDYDEFIECLGIVEEAGGALGISQETLSALKTAYEALFYPNQYNYIIKNGKKLSIIPPQNASEEAGLTEIRVGDQSIYLDMGPYYFEKDSLFKKTGEETEPIKVSSYPVVPIGAVVYPDGTEKIVIWFKRFGMEKNIEEQRTIVYDKKKIKRLIAYGLEPSDSLVEYFMTIEELNREPHLGFQTIIEGKHMGWIDDSYTSFYPYDNRNYRCSMIPYFKKEYDSVMSVAGTLDGWIEAVNQFRDHDHVAARIVLATSFASALIKPVNTLPVILHIWGTKSGSGKTMALTTAASIWGNPMRGGYLASLNSTEAMLISRAQFFCNYPLCLDELQTVKNKRSLQDMIYNLSEGEPRGALTAGRNSDSWANTILTSGEQSILTWTVLEGARNRVIEIPCGSSFVYSDDADTMARYFNQLKENHGQAGRRFIECLKNPGSIDRVKSLYQEFITMLNRQATNKQILAAAAILTADELACDWIFHDDLKLSIEDLLPFLKNEDDIDVGTSMQEYIYEWIATNKPRMERAGKLGKLTEIKGKRVCAIPSEVFRSLMADKGYDTRAYFSWAVEHDKALRDDDGRHFERRVTINGESIRCACIVMPPAQE